MNSENFIFFQIFEEREDNKVKVRKVYSLARYDQAKYTTE
jgi:hypothetical protein